MKSPVFSTSLILLLIMLGGCFLYEEYEFDNPYDPDAGSRTVVLPENTVTIDGDVSDWDAVETLLIDSVGEELESGFDQVPGGDLYEIKATQDEENLYFLVRTADGYPLQTPGSQINLQIRTDEQTFSIGLHHQVEDDLTTSRGVYEFFGRQEQRISEEEWDSIHIDNAPVKFAGIDSSGDAMELALAKSFFWDSISADEPLDFNVDGNLRRYDDIDGDDQWGMLDGVDNADKVKLIVKRQDDPSPSSDTPAVVFPRGSIPTIDGNLSDLPDWEEYGIWYQDIEGDDSNLTEPNTDIDTVHMKQDDDFIYFLITFYDSGPVGANTNMNMYVQKSDGEFGHTFFGIYTGTWSSLGLNYDSFQDITGHLAASDQGFIEFRFNKYLVWNDLPAGSCKFDITIQDSSGSDTDRIVFSGSYKVSSDAPAVDL